MIIVKEFPDRKFETKEELFTALRENKADLIATKKMQLKQADSVFQVMPDVIKTNSNKAEEQTQDNVNRLKAELVINTTNIMDSHSDVHLKGIWNKTVKEQKNIYLLQEHKMTFDHIISDNVSAKVVEMKWSDLGFNYKGTTEALIFWCYY